VADQPAASSEHGTDSAHAADSAHTADNAHAAHAADTAPESAYAGPGGKPETAGRPADQARGADPRDTDPRDWPRASSVRTPPAKELEATIRDLDDRWRRALADFDNLNKRLAREVARTRSDERDRVVALLLPVVDNLELALEHATADPAALIEGIRSVRDQAVAVLEHLGFGRRDEVGVPFDPARHEAVAIQADAGVAPGTVVRVVRPGYGNDDRQLRPAAVVVASRE
jgi:molecular chaperone GrpE